MKSKKAKKNLYNKKNLAQLSTKSKVVVAEQPKVETKAIVRSIQPQVALNCQNPGLQRYLSHICIFLYIYIYIE